MLSYAVLAGLWMSSCFQTQINGRFGYVIESYTFFEEMKFRFDRQWYKDETCLVTGAKDSESGTIKLLQGSEVDFIVSTQVDHGVLQRTDGSSPVLRVGRGVKGGRERNLTPGSVEYKFKKI